MTTSLSDDIQSVVLALRAIGARLPDDKPQDLSTAELTPLLQDISEAQFLAQDLVSTLGTAFQTANVREIAATIESEGQ